MKGLLTVITVEGSYLETPLQAPPSLEVLQKAVGGYLEAVPGFDTYKGNPCVVFCNEEGKLNGLVVNILATTEWLDALSPGVWQSLRDVLVGPIAIVTGDAELLGAL